MATETQVHHGPDWHVGVCDCHGCDDVLSVVLELGEVVECGECGHFVHPERTPAEHAELYDVPNPDEELVGYVFLADGLSVEIVGAGPPSGFLRLRVTRPDGTYFGASVLASHVRPMWQRDLAERGVDPSGPEAV